MNKTVISTILGTALIGLIKSKGSANLAETENSWGIRLAMLKGFLALDKQERGRIMPPDIEDYPRSLYDNQEYGAPYFNEMSVQEVSSHLRGCWLDDFNEDSYPWQTLIREEDGEIQFWEFWSSECFEGLKTKPRYSRFMQGNISNWDIGKIIETFDKDFNSILLELGYEVSKTEIIPLRTEFISITHIKPVNKGSKYLIDPNKLQKEIDVDFTFSIIGPQYIDPLGEGGNEDKLISDAFGRAQERLSTIFRYSQVWQDQMGDIRNDALNFENFRVFLRDFPVNSMDEAVLSDDLVNIIESIKELIYYIFVFKNLLAYKDLKIIRYDLNEDEVTMSCSLKIKLMNAEAVKNLLPPMVDMISWTGSAEGNSVDSITIDPKGKMNEETKRLVFGMNDSELRKF